MMELQSVENETFLCKGLDLVSGSLWMRDRRCTTITIMLNLLCFCLGWFIGTCLGKRFWKNREIPKEIKGCKQTQLWGIYEEQYLSRYVFIEWGSLLTLRIKKLQDKFLLKKCSLFCLELQTFEIAKNLMLFSSHNICHLRISDILSFFDKQ